MKHKILLVVLGLVLLTLYLGCQKDDGSESTESSTDIQDVISRRLPFEVIPHFTKVDDKINKLRIKLNTKGEVLQKSLDIDSVTIRTDEILYMTYAQTHTYTFKLLRTNPQYYIENIVLHYNVDTESYDEYLVQYDINQQEFLDIYSGSYVGEESKAIITDLDSGTVSTILSKSGCRRTCETISVNCSASGNHAPGQACNTGVSIDQWAYTYESCTTTCTEEEDASIDPGPSGGGGGGGNSAVNTNPEPNEPCERIINGQTYVGIIDTEGNCITVDDEDEEIQNSTTPCDELKKLGTDEKIKDSYEDIQGKVEQPREYGYSFALGSDPVENPLANGNTLHMRVPKGGLIYGYSHTHPNITNPPDKIVFPMFTTPDLFNLGLIAVLHSNPGTPKDYNLFFATMTVKNNGIGTAQTETYAIKISNIILFSQFLNSYGPLSASDKIRYNRKLKRKYQDEYESGGGLVSANYLKVLYKFLESEKLGGKNPERLFTLGSGCER